MHSVASSSSKAETERGKRQGILQIWWRSAKSSDQAAKTNIDIGWKKGRAILAERKMNTRTVHFSGLKNER